MRWARFMAAEGAGYGIVEGDRIATIEGNPMGEYRVTGHSHALTEVSLLPPIVPRNFFCVGFNYLGHTREAAEMLGKELKIPRKPDIGSRFPGAITGHDCPVIIPADSDGLVQFEGELVAIIGREAKGLGEGEILDCVFGYTIGNDITERSWQAVDRTPWRAKSSDTFKPIGPWIETEVDLPSMITRVRLNGELVSEFGTNEMIFSVATYLAEINRYMTLAPGDMIWMGTQAPCLDMRAGDLVEVEIDQIGVLRNRIIAA